MNREIPPDDEFRRRVAELEARVEMLAKERDRLAGTLDQSQNQSREDAFELGRLRAIADRQEEVVAERDRAPDELAEFRVTFEERLAAEIESAAQRLQERYEQAVAGWKQEAEELRGQVHERDESERKEDRPVAPTRLADSFIGVLAELAEGRPDEGDGKGFSAALTGLDVEAKGLLTAPEDEEGDPLLVLGAVGTVPAEKLSTMRMTFRLLPRVAGRTETSGSSRTESDE